MKRYFHRDTTSSYLLKGAVIVLSYVVTAQLGDILSFINVFHHNQYPPYWPPAGVAFGLILVFGPAHWPAIALASLLLMPDSYAVTEQSRSMGEVAVITAGFTLGRCLEPLLGVYLVKRFCPRGSEIFGTPKIALTFLWIASMVSVVGSALASSAIQFVRYDAWDIFLYRFAAWYVDSLVGILLFTPLVLAIRHVRLRGMPRESLSVLIAVLAIVAIYSYYLPVTRQPRLNSLFTDSAPFLVIAILLWLAFRYHVLVFTVSLVTISVVAVYFTTHGGGPFVMQGDWQYSVWMLQIFLVVASASSLLSYAAASERRVNEKKLAGQTKLLTRGNQKLRATLERLEEARDKAKESERLKSMFLTNISHEIRTPMNAIMGFSELLERPNLPAEKRQEFSRLIYERSFDLLNIVNDILDISKIEAGQVSVVPVQGNLNDFLNRLMVHFQAETNLLKNKNVTVSVVNFLDPHQVDIVADFTKLRQVLSNLLSNAIKFTDTGTIRVMCRKQNDHQLLFMVEDTGIGIPPEKHELIFMPFRQASETIHQYYGGSGLGLAICHGLVELWGGGIWLESRHGQGSTFYFTMPYNRVGD